MKTNTVYIVDDDLYFRKSMIWLLESADYQVQAFNDAEDFLAAYDVSFSGCLLLDVRMTGMSGIELQHELNQRDIQLPVIMLTGHADVGTAVQAMKNRAVDFVEKPFDDALLLDLIEKTLQSNQAIEQENIKNQEISNRWQSLSKREKQVADLVINGLVNREIAEQLGISIKTVEIHRSQVMKKMAAKNVVDLMNIVKDIKIT